MSRDYFGGITSLYAKRIRDPRRCFTGSGIRCSRQNAAERNRDADIEVVCAE
jgi:hypothetical protein